MRIRSIAWLIGLLSFIGVEVPLVAADPARVDYERQIKPIFEKYCFDCHSTTEQESSLRVDAASLAIQGGARGPGIVPGDSGKSLLYQAIRGEGDVPPMPYEEAKLSAEQIELIRRWIDEGAKFPADEPVPPRDVHSDHWAFQPISRPKVPCSPHSDWVRNPIDAFVSRRLAQESLRPSEEADRLQLIRRLSFDLLGLPPTIDEVDEFLSDTVPGGYERLVDRLLASPAYGEHWGRHWLDAARYADSHGYTIDGPRSIWRYRDWVIDAINADLPFDQFTIDQLAGDMIPNRSPDDLVATGFHRNTLLNQEGGVDAEQYRIEAVADRVETTGSVFMGLTVGCARCHDHKFDPITQREYYELFAIFNNCDEPKISMPTNRETRRLEKLVAGIRAAEQAIPAYDARHRGDIQQWIEELVAAPRASWLVGKPVEFRSKGGATLTRLDDGSLMVSGEIPKKDTYDVVVELPLDEITAVRVEVLADNALPNGGPGLSEDGSFVLHEFELQAGPLDTGLPKKRKDKPVNIDDVVADWSPEGYDVKNILDRKPGTGWTNGASAAGLPRSREFIVRPAEPIRNAGGSRLKLRFHQLGPSGQQIGKLRISATSETDKLAARVPESLRAVAAMPSQNRTTAQQEQIAAMFRNTDDARRKLVQRHDHLVLEKVQAEADLTTTMVLEELKTPRTTHVHIRGDFLRPGALVTPGVPAVLSPQPDTSKNFTRLEFAKWLCDPSNPLTARVTVNRSWQRFFGAGLVNTENDFGSQGDPPSHPALLDWLAGELIRRNWSMKSLHRLIVTSATYRQSSRFSPELLERDPANHLLARQSRLRLQAETIRDASLAVSGLLSHKVGGPSVHPPQPEGIYVLTQQRKEWKVSKAEDRYRRGMYTFFWRSSPYPFLVTFDAPNANTACTRRARSNTPLQALTLANDPVFFECAQSLGRMMIVQAPPYDAARLQIGFRTCLSREPSDPELGRLADFLEGQRRYFHQHEEAARIVAFPDRIEDIETSEAAAWTAVARVLLNLDEFITRE